jgi:hypothetical protein
MNAGSGLNCDSKPRTREFRDDVRKERNALLTAFAFGWDYYTHDTSLSFTIMTGYLIAALTGVLPRKMRLQAFNLAAN